MSKQRDWIQWPDPEFVGMLLFVVMTLLLSLGGILLLMALSQWLLGEPR